MWYNTIIEIFSMEGHLMGEIDDFVNDGFSSRGSESNESVCLPDRTPLDIHRTNIKKYGLSPDQYDELSSQQGDKCVICGGINNNGKRLFVDHCHKTGKIRDLLCGNCNSGLGFFGDNPQVLANAIEYLKKASE